MTDLNIHNAPSKKEHNVLPLSGHFLLDIAPLLLTAIILMVQFSIFKDFTPHIPLVCGIAITGIFVFFRKGKWQAMEDHFMRVIKIGLPAVMILMGFGMLIASWIAAGTVPTILYYGFNFFTPGNFLFIVCILCSVISLATGTSWGTAGTIGIAMMGIGEGLGIPAGITAGAVLSGALFGDKMSPFSDTTNLTPAAAEVDLWDHIKGMMPTTVPATIISLALYAWLGYQYSDNPLNTEVIEQIQKTIGDNYHISLITLLPAVIVIGSAVFKMPALSTAYLGVFSASVIAITIQGVGVHDLFNILQNGVKSQTGFEIVDNLLSRGGVMSMTWVVSLTLFALGFVGSLEYYGTLRAIMNKMNHLIRTRLALVGTTYTGVISVGVLIGDVYTTLVLPGRLLKDKYDQLGYNKTTLTRAVEDCGTMLSPIIPWNMGGSFFAATLGVATLTYAPYAFALWLSPLIGFLWVIMGKFIPKNTPEQMKNPKPGAKWEGL